MRGELRVEDALLYLDQVKVEFGDRPHIYNEFLDIMKTFKTQQIDTPGVIRRVSTLFQGNRRLVLGFNTFLPEGYKIEIPPDGKGPPVAVYCPPGSDVSHILRESDESKAVSVAQVAAMANAQQQQQRPQQQLPPEIAQHHRLPPPPRNHQPPPPPPPPPDRVNPGALRPSNQLPLNPGGVTPRGGIRDPPPPPRSQQQQQPLPGGVAPRVGRQPPPPPPPPRAMPTAPQNGAAPIQRAGSGGMAEPQAQQPPMEFDHAINYVSTIKRRFSEDPNTYKKFLEILHTYQKEQRGIKEVLDEVSELFGDHPDLLREFTFFLPDAVQSQAKAQLEQAVKIAEQRKMQKSQDEIMKIGEGVMPRSVNPTNATPRQSKPLDEPQNIQGRVARTAEREESIIRGVQHGSVSFNPVRPSRLRVTAKPTRPTHLPVRPPIPFPREAIFFVRVKDHLGRRELATDKTPGSKRHTPYTEFLKYLQLFGAGILSKEHLLLFLKGLFHQGHAPKNSTAANSGSTNQMLSVATEATNLLNEFEDILVGRGPFARQENTAKDVSKFGTKRMRDLDFTNCSHPTPSYRKLPPDFPTPKFFVHPGRFPQDASVLNGRVVCINPDVVVEQTSEGKPMRKRKAPSVEECEGARKRHNLYEKSLLQIEEERYELDMAIERNKDALRRVEPYAEEVRTLREQEENDGQPIGRLQYKLSRSSLNSIHLNAIGRLYGDRGDEILQHLMRNPLVVLPIVYKRLKQKDAEWRRVKSELKDVWYADCKENYEGSFDVRAFFNRKALEKSFALHRLLDHCKRARVYIKHPDRIKRHPATEPFEPTFSRFHTDPGAVLYQPGFEVPCVVDTSHYHAFQLVMTRLKATPSLSPFQHERIGRIWAEFVAHWYDYPSYWIAGELRESFTGTMGAGVTQYAAGQRVTTIFGEGTIASFTKPTSQSGPCYRVRLPFGLGFLSPSSILHAIQSKETPFMRRDGMMIRDETPMMDIDNSATSLGSQYKLLFGTENMFLFIRLHSLICSILSDCRSGSKDRLPCDPADQYVNPFGSQKKPRVSNLSFVSVLEALKKRLSRTSSVDEVESLARKVCPDKVYQVAALTKLVDRCVDSLSKMAEEDAVLLLYDNCQFGNADPAALRAHCLSNVPDAFFRIQFNKEAGTLWFGFQDFGELPTSPPREDDDDYEDDTNIETGDEPMDEYMEIDMSVMNGAGPGLNGGKQSEKEN